MSKSPAIQIQPIDFDKIEEAVELTAQARGLPKHVYPAAVPAPLPTAVQPVQPLKKKRAVCRFTVEVPDYVAQQIYARAAATNPRSTSKHVVLSALKAIGIRVDDEDLVTDGRRNSTGQ